MSQRNMARSFALKERQRRRRNARNAKVIGIMLFLTVIIVFCIAMFCGDKPTEPQIEATATPASAVTIIEATDKPDEVIPHENNTALLPILKRAATDQKRVAITIDDLNQVGNLNQILDICEEYGAKVTLFALGMNVKKCATVLQRAQMMGMEIENHTFTHSFVYKLEDDELIYEIQETARVLNEALEINYEMHFFRPPGGNGIIDPRLHKLLNQTGYQAVVYWSLSGTRKVDETLRLVEPGDVILFHTTDADLSRLRTFIPAMVQLGYEMVTLNELYGYDDNKFGVDVADPAVIAPPITDESIYDGITYSNGTRMYGVKLLQNRLIELGYLAQGNADGDYGDVTVQAVKNFALQAGISSDGSADLTMRNIIYAPDAPVSILPPLSVKDDALK